MNLNKVFLIGRLTRDPEARTTPSGQLVCNFGLATNRVWTNRETNQKEEKTEFHNIVLWRRLAEIASQYLTKGSLVLIEGRVQTRSWEDQSGNKKYKTEVIAENIQLGPRTASRESSPATDRPKVNSQTVSFEKKVQEQIPKEDIPIIEEEKPSSANASDNREVPEDEEKEIDIKDIPF